jgi:hypothetical protein
MLVLWINTVFMKLEKTFLQDTWIVHTVHIYECANILGQINQQDPVTYVSQKSTSVGFPKISKIHRWLSLQVDLIHFV